MEEDYKKPPPSYEEVITEQHTSNTRQSQPADRSQNCCCRCCLSTRNCLMSPECGRALNIASVVAMCGMCIRMFVFMSWFFAGRMLVLTSKEPAYDQHRTSNEPEYCLPWIIQIYYPVVAFSN